MRDAGAGDDAGAPVFGFGQFQQGGGSAAFAGAAIVFLRRFGVHGDHAIVLLTPVI